CARADSLPPVTPSSPDAATAATCTLSLHDALPISIVAYDQRRRRGQQMVEPRTDLGYSANFLQMTFGQEAAEEVQRAFDVSMIRSEEHTSELQSRFDLVCRLLLEKKNRTEGSDRQR